MEHHGSHELIPKQTGEVLVPKANPDSSTVQEQERLRSDLSPWDWAKGREVPLSVLHLSAV